MSRPAIPHVLQAHGQRKCSRMHHIPPDFVVAQTGSAVENGLRLAFLWLPNLEPRLVACLVVK